jgi:signal transduction histidine kinase
VFVPLSDAIERTGLPVSLLHDLLSAFEQDVTRTAAGQWYDTHDELLAYCTLSANPVGRLLLHLYGVTDPQRLGQILKNLIGNALQHGGGTPVLVRVARGERVELTVTNHGPTIPPETHARLFEPFARGERAEPGDRGTKSVGLGLYISSQIIQAHGGQLRLESDQIAGTRFTIALQAA